MPIRVLLVDDVVEVRRLVRTSLRFRGGFEVVGEAADGAEAVRLAAQLRPDVVVLDLGLPDIAGREVLSRVRAGSPDSKVVVFSGLETVDRAWIDDNAAGFVLKDADLGYLVDLLEAVGRPNRTEATIDLPDDLSSVATARRFVRETLAEWGIAEPFDDALLVVSELAANALTHGQSSYRVRLATTGHGAADRGRRRRSRYAGAAAAHRHRGARSRSAPRRRARRVVGHGDRRRRRQAGLGRARAPRRDRGVGRAPPDP